MNTIKAGRYRHYKGQDYQVLEVARHTETQQEFVVYRALYGERGLWLRPYTMFTQTVNVDGKEQPRFAFIAEK